MRGERNWFSLHYAVGKSVCIRGRADSQEICIEIDGGLILTAAGKIFELLYDLYGFWLLGCHKQAKEKGQEQGRNAEALQH